MVFKIGDRVETLNVCQDDILATVPAGSQGTITRFDSDGDAWMLLDEPTAYRAKYHASEICVYDGLGREDSAKYKLID